MADTLKFAHFTDVHLPIPGRPGFRALLNKRLLGYLSWTRKRQHWHKREVSDALVADMRRSGAEVALLSGDVVNIGLETEFEAAQSWLDQAFAGLPLMVAPGNHDAYVPAPWASTLGRLGEHMTGARPDDAVLRPPRDPADFPYVRDWGPAAVIVANSAPPTAPGLATGALGAGQVARIEAALKSARGRFRILLLHHPVSEGAVSRRKALDDRKALLNVFAGAGVDLILHGHAHVPSEAEVATPTGPAPAIGGGSFSHPRGAGDRKPGRYNLFTLERTKRGFLLSLEVRQYDPATGGVASVDARVYDRPAALSLST
jgi:3',5'-cyclic AMP phosphodiesterase CpdA